MSVFKRMDLTEVSPDEIKMWHGSEDWRYVINLGSHEALIFDKTGLMDFSKKVNQFAKEMDFSKKVNQFAKDNVYRFNDSINKTTLHFNKKVLDNFALRLTKFANDVEERNYKVYEEY